MREAGKRNAEGLSAKLTEGVWHKKIPCSADRNRANKGINGILIPVNDLKKLVDAMKTCTKREVAEELSAEALQLKETLTSDIVFEQWHDFLLMEEKKQI